MHHRNDAVQALSGNGRRGTGGHHESHPDRRTPFGRSARKITTASLREKKLQHEPITCLTAYDYSTARLVDEAGIDMVLVGDSLAQTMLGYENTLSVTMDEMLHHVKAVRRGVKNALLVADMPYGSYQIDAEDAVRNAARFVKEGGRRSREDRGRREAGRPDPADHRCGDSGRRTHRAHSAVGECDGRIQGAGKEPERRSSSSCAMRSRWIGPEWLVFFWREFRAKSRR